MPSTEDVNAEVDIAHPSYSLQEVELLSAGVTVPVGHAWQTVTLVVALWWRKKFAGHRDVSAESHGNETRRRTTNETRPRISVTEVTTNFT